jgi:hypothetical protein
MSTHCSHKRHNPTKTAKSGTTNARFLSKSRATPLFLVVEDVEVLVSITIVLKVNKVVASVYVTPSTVVPATVVALKTLPVIVLAGIVVA